MNATTFVTITATLLLGACSTLSTTENAGKVVDITAAELRLCFPVGAAPVIGQNVRIVRPVAVGGVKPPLIYQDQTVGAARISVLDGGCATARLVAGDARRDDRALWPEREPPK